MLFIIIFNKKNNNNIVYFIGSSSNTQYRLINELIKKRRTPSCLFIIN